MKEIIINGKALYTPKGAAREYAAVGCNFFTGCPHNCSYCYLKRGAPSKQLGGTEVKLKKCFKDEVHARQILEKEMDANLEYLQEVGIFLSFTTDPLIKETRSLTATAILCALSRDIPVMVLTKNSDFVDDEEFMCWMENIRITSRDMVAFGFSLTGRDDMEPNASLNADRIVAMKKLNFMGFKTWASIEPIVDFKSSLTVIHDTLIFCDMYKVGLMSGVKKDYYDDGELASFVGKLATLYDTRKTVFYIKDSIRKRFLNPIIDCISVNKDYNIFKQ